jgi:hypothetical protein
VGLDQEIRGALGPAMWLLMGAVAFLLLIACVNVANLLLVRGDARVREMAVRTAIGASPARLMRQLFTESAVLAIGGALIGLGLSSVALAVLTSVHPTSLPPLAPVRLDTTVIAFTLLLAVATTLLFGLAPALRTLHVDLVESLGDGGQHATVDRRRQRLRGALVAAEGALAVVLVIGAGLMIRTLAALGDVDLGFNPDRVLTMRMTIPAARCRASAVLRTRRRAHAAGAGRGHHQRIPGVGRGARGRGSWHGARLRPRVPHGARRARLQGPPVGAARPPAGRALYRSRHVPGALGGHHGHPTTSIPSARSSRPTRSPRRWPIS